MKTKPQRGDIIDKAVSGMGLMHKALFFYLTIMVSFLRTACQLRLCAEMITVSIVFVADNI